MTKEQRDALVEQYREDPYKVKKYGHAGIYCIKINDKIVYVGKSVDMLVRIADHSLEIMEGTNKSNKYKVLHKAYNSEECHIEFDVLYVCRKKNQQQIFDDIGEAEARYINQYMPALNYQIPTIGDYKHFSVNKKAQVITLEEILGKQIFIF